MTLVLGTCLAKRIYLLSDSRLTKSDGTYSDDFAKWVNLNSRIVVIASGSARFASYLIHQIRDRLTEESTFNDLESVINYEIKVMARAYYAKYQDFNENAGLIFGGFDTTKNLKVGSRIFGQVLSAQIASNPKNEGRRFEQVIDPDMRDAMSKVFETAERWGVDPNGLTMDVNTPQPRICAVQIEVDMSEESGVSMSIEDIGCYESVSFHPKFRAERIQTPVEVLSALDYPIDLPIMSGEQVLYHEAETIISYANRISKERKYPSVGGNFVPIVITPSGMAGMVTGKIAQRQPDGTSKLIGGYSVVENKLHYYNEAGELLPYRFLYDYIDTFKDQKDDLAL